MCQSKNEGGKRCVHDSSGTRALAYEAERGYGLNANYVKKVSTSFRKEAIHNGISDTEEAPQEEVEAFVEERKEEIEANEKMKPAEKRTAIRGWMRALKEKVSMATLYSWKKVAAIMVAGSVMAFSTACTRAEEKVPEPPETTSTQTVGPTDSTTVDEKDQNANGPFGYDFSNIPISDKIKEQYGEKASQNILTDTFTPMELMKTNQNLYQKGEKTSKMYYPLKPFMTPEAWKRDVKDFDSEDKNVKAGVFPAMAINCDSDGTTLIVKKGKKADKNLDNYNRMICDETQKASNTKLSDIKVDTYKRQDDDVNLVKIPQHVTVSGTQTQTFTGKDDEGKQQFQTMNIDFTFYLVPDSQKQDHWLIDAGAWSYTFGPSSYNVK